VIIFKSNLVPIELVIQLLDSTNAIAFLVYPGCNILDLTGPLEVMAEFKRITHKFEIVTVGETTSPMKTDVPLQIIPTKTFDEVEAPHVIIVPGGGAPTIQALGNEVLLSYLRKVSESAEIVASVCTGSLILAASGLLYDRNATTHWEYGEFLKRLGVNYTRKRWVEDGKFLTAAGVSAGIDMALYLVARLSSDEISRKVQLGIEYDPNPPLGKINWSEVDLSSAITSIEQQIREELAHKPDLKERLLQE